VAKEFKPDDLYDYDYHIYAQNAWDDGIEVLIKGIYKRELTPRKDYVVSSLNLIAIESPGIKVEPIITLSRKVAQQLMDDLWHCGLRPTEGMGSIGEQAATEKHLEDMRKVAFQYLDYMKSIERTAFDD
jgi:hypothetical protein